MSDDQPQNAITVRDLSKSYRISHQLEKNRNPTIKDAIVNTSRKVMRAIGTAGGYSKETVWALKDVNFDVAKGDIVGVVGINGSGKSTLFKILSQVTSPTEGEITINGRYASLLEVGTGFHDELTGRENVYFNGAILGLSKAEIDEKFDEIVEFSEIEKFIDTPIKFYSSGMKVRLAFSVATQLEAEILIVDEVLSVGDKLFREKSLEKMKELAAEGRTILFVSHMIEQLRELCTRGIFLKEGELKYDGGIEEAINLYLDRPIDAEPQPGDERIESEGDKDKIKQKPILANLSLKTRTTKQGITSLKVSGRLDFSNVSKLELPNSQTLLGIIIRTEREENIVRYDNLSADKPYKPPLGGETSFTIEAEDLQLVPGEYNISVILKQVSEEKRKPILVVNHAANFRVPHYVTEKAGIDSKHLYPSPPIITDFSLEIT